MIRGSILHSHPRICIDEEHHLKHRVSIMAWAQHLASRWYTGSERIEDCMVGFMNQTLKECLTLPMAYHQLKLGHKSIPEDKISCEVSSICVLIGKRPDSFCQKVFFCCYAVHRHAHKHKYKTRFSSNNDLFAIQSVIYRILKCCHNPLS